MFRETITSADGTTEDGACSEAHALAALQRAVRLGYTVEATRSGGVVIVREIPAVTDRWRSPRKHTVTFEPAVPAGKITATNRMDLAIIGRRMGGWGSARLDPETGRINAGLNSIPPGVSRRLIDRGLVAVNDGAVTVSLAARLAMLAQDHRTETSEPFGYYNSLGADGRPQPGLWTRKRFARHDSTSVASCSCRGWSYPAEDRDDARRKAHGHRQEATVAMVRDLAA